MKKIIFSEGDLTTDLSEISLSGKNKKLLNRISAIVGDIKNVQDVVDIDVDKLPRYLGLCHSDILLNLQKIFPSSTISDADDFIFHSEVVDISSIEDEHTEVIDFPMQNVLPITNEEFKKIFLEFFSVSSVSKTTKIIFPSSDFYKELILFSTRVEKIKKQIPQITLSEAQLETPLAQLALSPQYEKLIKRISSSMGVVNTVKEILDIDPITFSNVPAIGKTYIDLLINLQNEFELEKTKKTTPQITLSMDQLETPIKQLALSIEYKRLLKRISTALKNVNTVADIINIDPIEFSELPKIGKTYVKQLIEFQKQLPAFLENQTQKSALFTENYSIELSEIDNVLIEDVEGYLWTLDERKMDIALSRWGFNQPHESMEEIGKRYDITKAAIGNIEKPINTNLPLNFRIQPKVLWANIREKMTEDLTELLPNLARCFESEKLFYSFIELCCQVESGSIQKIIFTKINPKIINSFFCFNPSPISQEIIVNELMSNYGHSKASAVNGLKQLAKNDRIEITEQGISPKKLARPEAVAHVLAFHPAGLPWKDIARIV